MSQFDFENEWIKVVSHVVVGSVLCVAEQDVDGNPSVSIQFKIIDVGVTKIWLIYGDDEFEKRDSEFKTLFTKQLLMEHVDNVLKQMLNG